MVKNLLVQSVTKYDFQTSIHLEPFQHSLDLARADKYLNESRFGKQYFPTLRKIIKKEQEQIQKLVHFSAHYLQLPAFQNYLIML